MYFIQGVLLEFARVSSLHLAQAPPVTSQEGACAISSPFLAESALLLVCWPSFFLFLSALHVVECCAPRLPGFGARGGDHA